MNLEIQKQEKHTLENIILGVLALIFLGATAWLIVLYNKKVEYVNGAAELKEEIQLVEAENVAHKERIFALFHNGEVEQFAKDLGLVKEQNPEYLELNKSWVVSASRF